MKPATEMKVCRNRLIYKGGLGSITVQGSLSLVSRSQTLFRVGRHRLQYKCPRSKGLAQFTGLKFTRATSGW